MNDLRDQHARRLRQGGRRCRGPIHGELDVMTAEDLGHVDTFREEEERVLAGAVAALKAQDWQKAQLWCKAREGDKSFWVRRDRDRRLVWDSGGRGRGVRRGHCQQPRPFADVTSHEEALAVYARRAFRVDRAHRRFEQRVSPAARLPRPAFGGAARGRRDLTPVAPQLGK